MRFAFHATGLDAVQRLDQKKKRKRMNIKIRGRGNLNTTMLFDEQYREANNLESTAIILLSHDKQNCGAGKLMSCEHNHRARKLLL